MDFFVFTYLFRFYVQFQKKQDYKALHFNENLAESQYGGQQMPLAVPGNASDHDTNSVLTQEMPMYSVSANQGNNFTMTNAGDSFRAKV